MQNAVTRTTSWMKVLHDMVNRGMVQSLTVPQKKMGAGRVVIHRRSPDLRTEEAWSYKHLPKILDVVSTTQDKPQSIYCGFDPTAPGLHLGHMTVLSVMLNLVKNGYHVIALVGGATAHLGDPSGKTENRKVTAGKAIRDNADAMEQQLKQIFQRYCVKHNVNVENFQVLNNSEWYKGLTVKDYIDMVGSEFKVVDMLDRAVVKSRLKEKDMRFSEFVYQTFQAYDWLHLYRHHDCAVQIGGYDQIGNIEDGYSYMWKVLTDRPPLAGVTVPLVVTENREKLGKTSGNAVWLDQTTNGSMSLAAYLDSLTTDDLLTLAQKLTTVSLEELQVSTKPRLSALILEELLPLVT